MKDAVTRIANAIYPMLKFLMFAFAFINFWQAEQSAGQENWGKATYYMLWGFMFSGMFILFMLVKKKDRK